MVKPLAILFADRNQSKYNFCFTNRRLKKVKNNEIVLDCFQHPRVFELLPTQVTIKYLQERK